MNIFDIEHRRGVVHRELAACTTPRQKLFILKEFFDLLLEQNNPAVLESYAIEFLEPYVSALSDYSPLYLHPEITEQILSQIRVLLNVEFLSPYHDKLQEYHSEISSKLNQLNNFLSGAYDTGGTGKLCFPVIELKDNEPGGIYRGFLETVTIKIAKASQEDKFIIVPLTGSPDEKLTQQIKTSWKLALDFINVQNHKTGKYHEVIIHFDSRLGNYTGYSLGITLTIGFIEELLKYYNAPYLVNVKNSIALTGGINEKGKILPVGHVNISNKVETVFYSGVRSFIVPKQDEIHASKKLSELHKQFPERSLDLVPLQDLTDLLNRRNLIDIKKQNPIARTYKTARNNYITILLLALLVTLSSYYAIRDYDNNPAVLEKQGFTLHVKNKSGKILWSKRLSFNSAIQYSDMVLQNYCILFDINHDGINEVILTAEMPKDQNAPADTYKIACYDKSGNIVWNYTFQDSIYSLKEGSIPPFYGYSYIIGIDTSSTGSLELFLFSKSITTYPCAIYKLDPVTGKRLNGTLWHDGHIDCGFLKDINNDRQKEIIFTFINNSFEKVGFCAAAKPKGSEICPHKPDRYLEGTTAANLYCYLLVPNTDYNKLQNLRNAAVLNYSLTFDAREQTYNFGTLEDENLTSGVAYEIHSNLRDIDIVIQSTLRVRRDTLVAHGKLKPPFTDTNEYCELLKSQILFWNGHSFNTSEAK